MAKLFVLLCLLFVLPRSALLNAAESCSRPLTTVLNMNEPVHVCMADWLKKLFARANCQLQIRSGVDTSTRRRLLEVENGRFDFITGTTPLPERDHYAYFTRVYGIERTLLYVRSEDHQRWPIRAPCDDSMRQLRVLGPAQGWYGASWQAVRDGAACGQVSYYSGTALQARELLLKDRTDVLVAPDWMMLNADAAMRAQVQALDVVVAREPVALMFSRRTVDAGDVAHLDQAMQALLKESGAPCALGTP